MSRKIEYNPNPFGDAEDDPWSYYDKKDNNGPWVSFAESDSKYGPNGTGFTTSNGVHQVVQQKPERQYSTVHNNGWINLPSLKSSGEKVKGENPKSVSIDGIFGGIHLFESVNGKFDGKNYNDKYEQALIRATSESLSLVKDNPREDLHMFMNLLRSNTITEAYILYQAIDEKSHDLIKQRLTKVPWRITCEYCRVNDNIKWINTWVKIGWWNEDASENSPQLQKGTWISENITGSTEIIPTSCFESVVWSGYGPDMIIPCISGGNRITIELERNEDFLKPINVGLIGKHNHKNIYDLAFVDIGSLDPLQDHKLDMFRKHHSTYGDLHFFKGLSYGNFFVPETVILDAEDYSLNPEEDFELVYVEDSDSYND